MNRDLASALPAIYDAAASDGKWPAALDAIAKSSQARGTILMAFDLVGLPFQVQKWCTAYRDEDILRYFREFGRYEQHAVEQLRMHPTRTFHLDTDVWPNREEVAEREDYVFLKERYGVKHRAAARLSSNRGWSDMLAVQVDTDWSGVPPSFWQDLEFLMPHVAKVVEINRTFTLLRLRYQAALCALDHIGIGMCIALVNGNIIVANEEARRIFDTDESLRLADDGRLIARDENITRQIRTAIERTASTADGQESCAELSFACPRRSQAPPLLIEVCPLRDSSNELDPGLRGSLICIMDPSFTKDISCEGLAILFGFSPSEKAVCDALLQGRSTREVADIRNVSPETVRTQVKAVYTKTGVANRVELIRLAIGANPPIK